MRNLSDQRVSKNRSRAIIPADVRRFAHVINNDGVPRRPWLRELGQWLRAEYNAVDQPVPERLATLLKELRGRRH